MVSNWPSLVTTPFHITKDTIFGTCRIVFTIPQELDEAYSQIRATQTDV
jgi:hypothetical protein